MAFLGYQKTRGHSAGMYGDRAAIRQRIAQARPGKPGLPRFPMRSSEEEQVTTERGAFDGGLVAESEHQPRPRADQSTDYRLRFPAIHRLMVHVVVTVARYSERFVLLFVEIFVESALT